MLTKFSLTNESEMSQWDQFIESHPEGSPYRLSPWLRTIHETYAFEPLMYVAKDAGDKLTGVFPCFLIRSLFMGSRIVSLPFTDQCGPLFDDPRQAGEALAEIIREYGDRVKYIEVRSPLLQECGFACHNYYKRHVLKLSSDPSEVIKSLNKRTIQYSIKKARKAGVEIREENTEFGIEEFYRLNTLTRKKHGVPSQPLKYFKNLFDNMMAKGYASIFLAHYDSQVVAASLFFKLRDTLHYKYNASDPKYLSKVNPNHLLTWYAIEQACLRGYCFLDFGRTSPDNQGLMRYKEMWGAQAIDLPYYYYPVVKGASSTKENSRSYRFLTGLWRSLPDQVTERLGPRIYKHMG